MNFRDMLKPVSFARRKPGDDVPKPHVSASRNRRLAALAEARDIVAVLPGQDGEALHAIMTGRYDLSDIIQAIIDQAGAVEHLRIATLSFNGRNVQQLEDWTTRGLVKRLSLLCSEFFRAHNPECFDALLQAIPAAKVAAARNHCKVVALEWPDGRRMAIEGSSNLRSNSNREQLVIVNDAALHDWHAAWIDTEVSRHDGD